MKGVHTKSLWKKEQKCFKDVSTNLFSQIYWPASRLWPHLISAKANTGQITIKTTIQRGFPLIYVLNYTEGNSVFGENKSAKYIFIFLLYLLHMIISYDLSISNVNWLLKLMDFQFLFYTLRLFIGIFKIILMDFKFD